MSTVGYDGWGISQPSRKRLVLLLGKHVHLEAIPANTNALNGTKPERDAEGKLSALYLDVPTGDIWCRLAETIGGTVWPVSIRRIEAQTLPMNSKQPRTPVPQAVEMLPHMPVQSEDGLIGKLEGVVVDLVKGRATSLIIRVRNSHTFTDQHDPLFALQEVSGQRLLMPRDWVFASPKAQTASRALTIAATSHQITKGMVLREDDVLEQEVYAIIVKNIALQPFIKQIRFTVTDGVVRIDGPELSSRLRASLENEIWHVPGILDIDNRMHA